MEEDKGVKMYFKGGKGILDPVDINGEIIKPGDKLTWDYGDYGSYRDIPFAEHRKHEAFYLVKQGDGFLFAESIEPCKATIEVSYFYLHDFRFKQCKIIR